MFEEQYNDLFTAIDDLAERIRALGEKAPGSFADYQSENSVGAGDENLSAADMVKDLVKGQEVVNASLQKLIDVADDADDSVSEDMAIARQTVHQKNAWMLKSMVA